MQLTMRAIALLTATTLLVSAVVAAMFLSVVFSNLTAVVVPVHQRHGAVDAGLVVSEEVQLAASAAEPDLIPTR